MGLRDNKSPDEDWVDRWSRNLAVAIQRGWPATRDWVKLRGEELALGAKVLWPPTRDWVKRRCAEIVGFVRNKGLIEIVKTCFACFGMVLLFATLFRACTSPDEEVPSTLTAPAKPEVTVAPPVADAAPVATANTQPSQSATTTADASQSTARTSDRDIEAVKAAITFRARYPTSIRFAPVEEWTTRPGKVRTISLAEYNKQKAEYNQQRNGPIFYKKIVYNEQVETVYEGWVEQDDGFRNYFEAAIRTADIPNGYLEVVRILGETSDSIITKVIPIPPGKVRINYIKLDGNDILRSMPSPNDTRYRYRDYVDLEVFWRLRKITGGMFYTYSTGNIEAEER